MARWPRGAASPERGEGVTTEAAQAAAARPANTALHAPGEDLVQGIAITAAGQGFSFTRDALVTTFVSTAKDGTSTSSAVQSPYHGPAPIRDGTI